ncbi:MAG: hypothetical protein IPJ84_16420 [Bdellovibrionales bacterium]|nr:hypothetical protein [Bdellovibrionales bacterium]
MKHVLGLIILVFFSNPVLAAEEPAAGSALAPSLVPAVYQAAQVYSVGNEILLLLESPEQSKASVLVSSQVENAVLLGEMDEDTGLLVEQEFSELSGARYELPRSKEELLTAIGLPLSAATEDQDWNDLLRVHIETTLALSPHASRLVFEALGVSMSQDARAILPENPPEN